jgi:phospholipase A-2-activating protein
MRTPSASSRSTCASALLAVACATLRRLTLDLSRSLGSSNQIGDVKKENVPGIEALGRDGKKEGEVLMVKNEQNVVEAHQVRSQTACLLP